MFYLAMYYLKKNISQAFFYNMVHRNAAILGSIIGGYCPSVASKFCLGHLLLNCFLVNFMTTSSTVAVAFFMNHIVFTGLFLLTSNVCNC